MRRLLILCLSLALHLSVYGDERGAELLQKLSKEVEQMGCYQVEFSIELSSEQGRVEGEYSVDAQRYKLSVGGVEIYGDSSLRYTIDAANEEVIKERVDHAAPMIIANPATAFVGLENYFEAQVSSESGGQITLSLLPQRGEELFESSSLVLDAATHLPISISYVADGEQVFVEVKSFAPSGDEIPLLEAITYPAQYELIDLSN